MLTRFTQEAVWQRLGISTLALALAPVLTAQTFSALKGAVQDASRGAVPAVNLALCNVDQDRCWRTQSNSIGAYAFPSVPPGRYRLEAEAAGFKKFTRAGIRLEVAQPVELDLLLELGEITERVDVTAETPLLQTATSMLGEVVNATTSESLPLNGRNVLQLVALTPAISTTRSYRTAAVGTGSTGAVAFSANGGRNMSNMIMLDGSPQEIMGYSIPAYIPSPDALQEFTVQTNALSAEYGRTAGAVVNMVHRSGSSDFHGTAYYFVRNDILDANGFFVNRNGQQKAAFRYNQFGFTTGGPLTPSRRTTFFFVNYEGIRQVDPGSLTLTVPTASMLVGDFSKIESVIYDPSTIDGKGIRQPFGGNRVPQTRMNPVAVKLLSYYPAPTGAGVANNFFSQASARTVGNNISTRLDRQISPRQNLFGRFSWSNLDVGQPDYFSGPATANGGVMLTHSRSATLDDTLTIGGWVLHGNYGFAYHYNPRGPDVTDLVPSSFGFPGALDSAVQMQVFPRVQPDGYAPMGSDLWFIGSSKFQTHTWTGDASKLAGAHTIKLGGSYRLNRASTFRGIYPAGYYAFNEGWTRQSFDTQGGGDSLASLLLGLPSAGQLRQEPALSVQVVYGSLYLQDDFRVNPRLTLNLGLRWETDWPLTERHDRGSWFDPSAQLPLQVPGMGPLYGGLVFAGHRAPGAPRGIRDLYWKNFGPRGGLAFKLNTRTVIRSGFGMFFNPSTTMGQGTDTTGAIGFNAITPFISSIDGGRTPYATLGNPFPDGFSSAENGQNGLATFAGQSILGNFRSEKSSYSMQWNLSVQYELQSQMLIDVAYAGSAGVRLPASSEMNQLPDEALGLGAALTKKVQNPFFGVLPASTSLGKSTTTYGQLLRPYPWLTGLTHLWGNQAHSTYHALQAKFRKRYGNGLQFLLAYTWSKMIDDVSSVCTFVGQQNPGYTNSNQKRLDKSLSALDMAHNLTFNYQWELPFGRGRTWARDGWTARTLGDWAINGIAKLQSGLPLSISSMNNTTNSFGGAQRPNSTRISSVTPGNDKQRIDGWFDPAAFSDASPYSFGNVGRFLPDNRAPRYHSWDLSVLRTFPASERVRLQFRAEFFNLFNQVNFESPATVFGRPQFGLITAAERPRMIQFGLKLHY